MNNPLPENDPRLLSALKSSHQLGQQWCTDEDFQKIHADDKDWAAKEMADEGIQGNMYIIHGSLRDRAPGQEDQRVLMPVMFLDWPPPATMDGKPFGKAGAMRAIAARWVKEFPDHIPIVVSHIAEAWMAQGVSDKQRPKDWSPSKDPNRIEAVIVVTVSLDQRISHSYREIHRDSKEKFLRLGKDSGTAYVPGKPVDPRLIFDDAIMHFFMGYFAARGME